MSLELRLRREEREGANFFRSMDFRTGSRGFSRLLPAWKNGVRLPATAEKWWTPISEVYARLTLDDLRTIDGDAGKQDHFIQDSLTPTGDTTGLPILKLLLAPGDRVTDADVEYLAALACPPGCISAVAPLLYEYHISPSGRAIPHVAVDPDRYLEFVQRFVERAACGNRDQVQMTLPSNLPFSRVGRLLEIFRDVANPLLIVDAFGLSVRTKYAQIKKVIGFGEKGSLSLREKHGDNYALYAFDTKPSTGRGSTVAAQRLVQLDGGFSSYGPLRTNRSMVTLPSKPKPGRVFVPGEIAFFRPNIPGATADLKSWCVANGFPTLSADPAVKSIHSAHSGIRVAREMAEWAEAGILGSRLDSKSHIRKDLRFVRKSNGGLFATQTTLV
jgi:hypothetical protein